MRLSLCISATLHIIIYMYMHGKKHLLYNIKVFKENREEPKIGQLHVKALNCYNYLKTGCCHLNHVSSNIIHITNTITVIEIIRGGGEAPEPPPLVPWISQGLTLQATR